MSTLAQVMDELKSVIEDNVDSDIQVVARMNFNPTPPSIDIYPGDPFREETSAGFGDINGQLIFTVRARVTTADNEAGQETLLDLMDDESDNCVAGALLDDQTLNGLASSVKVEGPSGYTQFVDSGNAGALLGCSWRVSVLRVIT